MPNKTEQQYALYKMNERILDQMGIKDVKVPVREAMRDKIFGAQVDYELLIEEIIKFTEDNPAYLENYRELVGKIAYYVGLNLTQNGDINKALKLFALGLSMNPGNISLRSNYAAAFLANGQKDAALEQFLSIVEDSNVPVDPLIWVITARLLAEKGDYKAAFKLLVACKFYFPKNETKFWELYQLVSAKSGLVAQDDVVELDRSTAAVISAIENVKEDEIKPDGSIEDLFGKIEEVHQIDLENLFAEVPETKIVAKQVMEKPVLKKEEAQKTVKAINFCPACGAKMKAGAKFCGGCGHNISNQGL